MAEGVVRRRVVRTEDQSGPETDPAVLYGVQKWSVACTHCSKVLFTVEFTDRGQEFLSISDGGSVNWGSNTIYVQMCLTCSNRNYFYEEGVKAGRHQERKDNVRTIASQLSGIVEDKLGALKETVDNYQTEIFELITHACNMMNESSDAVSIEELLSRDTDDRDDIPF